MQLSDLQSWIAAYLGRNTTADFTLNGIDTLTLAINNAKRTFQRQHDFFYAQAPAALSIASTGSLITAATQIGGGTINIKRVVDVLLPISGGGYVPIELRTYDTYVAGVRRQVGLQAFDASKTVANLGITDDNVYAIIQGETILLAGSSTAPIVYPIAALLNTYQFMPDYADGTDTDFFSIFAPEALFWQAILEGNKFWRRFITKQEGNLDEQAVAQEAAESYASLLAWDASVGGRTTTPPPPPGQQQ